MLLEIGFQRFAMLVQFTSWRAESNFFEPLDTPVSVLSQLLAKRILRDAQDSRHLLVWPAFALEQQRFHLPLDSRMRMLKTLPP